MSKPTFGSLFAGIGGLDLGLERAGWECVWQVEIDDYANRVLAKNWPNVRRHGDVRTFPPTEPSQWQVDLVCGGFPCQGISEANYRAKGLNDERSGLWFAFARILGSIRPKFAILENVSALTFRGLGRVLSDLSTLGYDAEWQTIPASSFGAPHERERIFIVAYRSGQRCVENEIFSRKPFETTSEKSASRIRLWPGICKSSPALPNRIRWVPVSELCRMVNGLPDQLDRYRGLGNAVVPQVAEWIGRQLLERISP
jgi:DNA (cytosine-5)-methyltransferase 1